MSKFIAAMSLFSIIQFFTGCSNSPVFFNYGYNVSGGKVYYKQPFPDPVLTLEQADVTSFKVISRPEDSMYTDNVYYGTDKNNVYYRGYLVPGGNGPSFQLLDVNYAKDKSQCYYKGSLIPGADPATFTVKTEEFSVDRSHVFRRTSTIDNDATVFDTFPDSHVVHTANAVSIYDAIVPTKGANFKFLAFNYFALNNQVYAWENPLPDGDAAGFMAIDVFYCKINKHVYYNNKIIEGADPATFQLINSPYGRDDHHVFFSEKTIAEADPNTFEILNLNFQCSRDKHSAYHDDKKINTATAADLANKNNCNNCTDSAIYFAQ